MAAASPWTALRAGCPLGPILAEVAGSGGVLRPRHVLQSSPHHRVARLHIYASQNSCLNNPSENNSAYTRVSSRPELFPAYTGEVVGLL